ncbi:MAG: hypothetical protein IKU25_09430 [Clostridia bacterium]|nr:hypothetical protein [Clostridia bacterium]
MHELYELKKMLCEELEKYGKMKDFPVSELAKVDTIAHAAKNIGKLIEMCEEDEEEEMYRHSYRSMPYRGDRYMDGMSYARKRDARGRYSRGMGRYSYEDGKADLIERMEELMHDAPDEHTRQEIRQMIERMS